MSVLKTEMDVCRDNWSTPQELFDVMHQVFRFEIDACAGFENSKRRWFFAAPDAGIKYATERLGNLCIGVDGLDCNWGKATWCNPPGSTVAQWVDYAHTQVRDGICPAAFLLVQCGMGSGWYRRVRPYCETWLLTPRPQFVPPSAAVKKSSNARDYMGLIFTPHTVAVPGDRTMHFDWKARARAGA